MRRYIQLSFCGKLKRGASRCCLINNIHERIHTWCIQFFTCVSQQKNNSKHRATSDAEERLQKRNGGKKRWEKDSSDSWVGLIHSHNGYNLSYSYPSFQISLFGPVCLYYDLQKQSGMSCRFVENSDTAGRFGVKETHRGHPAVS